MTKLNSKGNRQLNQWKENSIKQFDGSMEEYRDYKLRFYLNIKCLGHLYVWSGHRKSTAGGIV